MSTYFKPWENETLTEVADQNIFQKLATYYNQVNDKLLGYKNERWIVVGVLALLYFFKILVWGGFYALTYCIGIHVLNSFLGFISPLDDPDEAEDGASFLPQK